MCRVLIPKYKKMAPYAKRLDRVESIILLAGQAAFLRRSRLTGLDARSFNHQFDRGEIESILNGLKPALGVGLLGFGPLGLN